MYSFLPSFRALSKSSRMWSAASNCACACLGKTIGTTFHRAQATIHLTASRRAVGTHNYFKHQQSFNTPHSLHFQWASCWHTIPSAFLNRTSLYHKECLPASLPQST